MRIKSLGEPLLSAIRCRRAAEDFRDVGLGLVIFDDATGVAEIVADQVRDQLHKDLAVVEDFAFERVGQDRVGNDQHEDGGEPAREENRDDDVVARKPVAVPPLKMGEEWDGLEPRHRRKADSALSPPTISSARPARAVREAKGAPPPPTGRRGHSSRPEAPRAEVGSRFKANKHPATRATYKTTPRPWAGGIQATARLAKPSLYR